MTVNQSELSYSATKMHLFVLLALETKVPFLAVLILPFISWSWWSRLKVIWVACQMLWSSLMVIPVVMRLDKGESLQPTKKSEEVLWLYTSYQGFFLWTKDHLLWSLLLIQKQDNHHSSVHVGHNRSLIRVKFQQATWPWNSDIRLNEMATNEIKVGLIPTGTWPTPPNVKRPYLNFWLGTYVSP